MDSVSTFTRDSLLRSFLTLGNDSSVIANSPRLRHPREGAATESGIYFIETDSDLSELALLKLN
ncbi:hypothetical protein ACED63_06445 [Vibrio splendidus]|uniref:hypothetical protein n=1 Tax=Vibrio splendidus TaxID=29497 RepID=UPI00352C8D22